jgi:hypothetical protein
MTKRCHRPIEYFGTGVEICRVGVTPRGCGRTSSGGPGAGGANIRDRCNAAGGVEWLESIDEGE